jgi:hypothetical protein
MNRTQLEHVLRACGSIAGCREIVVIGSQALLASYPDAPEALLRSMEVDCYPLDDPAKADLIDGSIGELSPFHQAADLLAPALTPRLESIKNRGTTPLAVPPRMTSCRKCGRHDGAPRTPMLRQRGGTSDAIGAPALAPEDEAPAGSHDRGW